MCVKMPSHADAQGVGGLLLLLLLLLLLQLTTNYYYYYYYYYYYFYYYYPHGAVFHLFHADFVIKCYFAPISTLT